MSLKLPPVVVVFIFGLLMYVLARFLPFGIFDFFGRTTLLKGLLVVMIFVLGASTYKFFKAKTTVNPKDLDKTSTLVTSGVYAYTRNPMYLAMLLLLIAWGLYLGNAFNSLLAAGFVSYINAYQIKPEEEVLTTKFGKEFTMYTKKVRRWF
ncbi:isoprenylcysteine carboxylmethyltransferase family protein [Cellulophaga sp. 20_2_10]|uniref:methyltransferase family protein n=1 Tax=Cellulophaga sp. 20_2_10 TaxID=2942476 RepID=UPI00201A4E58|nr:isoprenylcysteine carboxylmethyltransferase family protein [Cellulophaga sp. 20_2_10]MCL5245402.1 isoprenylcysteine carboxylmethyltransferase family protein [Cellulophaga sp. 20_2_10]